MGVKSNSNELCISFSFYGMTQICKYYKVYFFYHIKIETLFQILISIFMNLLFKRVSKVAVILVVDAL